MLETKVVERLAEVDRELWMALFPDEPEGYDYLLAIEQADLPGFRWRYLLVFDAGRLVTAAPAFLTEYPLETTLTGGGRRLAEGLQRLAPGALTLRLACIGSPCCEVAQMGFSADMAPPARDAATRALLAAFDVEAQRQRCGLLGLKDVAKPAIEGWARVAEAAGYRAISGLPTAVLDIDFPDLETYLARLSPGTRKDMRRKLKARDRVRIEVRDDIGDQIDAVMPLYAQTRARAEMTLEDLTPEFFIGVGRHMPGRAVYVFYYQGGDLLAVNLLIQGAGTLLDKFFCMDEARGRPLNLYFLSWFTNIELCLARGLGRYQAGQAAYRNKVRLGSRLEPTANYFRHRNSLVNGALRLAAPLFAAHPTERQAA